MLFAMILGIYSFMIASFIFIIKLASLTSLNVPYLYPLVSNDKNIASSIVQLPKDKIKRRSPKLTNNIFRSDNNEN